MKIIGVGRNYSEHIQELKNDRPTEPVIFLKPDTALLKNNSPFYHPDFSNNIHYEVELLVRIGKEGKNIEEKFASKYIDGIGIGIDFTARDLQDKAKEKGLPWTLAKGFNGSAPVSEFIPVTEIKDLGNINFSLNVNGNTVQKSNSNKMIFSFGSVISYISKFILLKKGDIIFTGTPEGVGKINIGDRLEAFIENEKHLQVDIK
jgi:2-keto-4-pentenoate hydratase/2-oxohepta-3-ene-1,7-dioic acid hydratase in catechol pathway